MCIRDRRRGACPPGALVIPRLLCLSMHTSPVYGWGSRMRGRIRSEAANSPWSSRPHTLPDRTRWKRWCWCRRAAHPRPRSSRCQLRLRQPQRTTRARQSSPGPLPLQRWISYGFGFLKRPCPLSRVEEKEELRGEEEENVFGVLLECACPRG